jgi:hypothetical protein
LWRHQKQIITAPWAFPDVQYFFDVAGFSSGKTHALVFMILDIAKKYAGLPVVGGIFEPTITFFRKTLWPDLIKYLVLSGSSGYSYNQNDNILRIGTVQFNILPMIDIFGFNLNFALIDELDELPQHKSVQIFTDIQERVRVRFPALTTEEKKYEQIYERIKDDEKISDAVKDEINERSGHRPFTVCVSTAQGYSGLYQIINRLDKEEEKYVLIRGETRDNKSLNKDFIARLERLYNENEKLAFLEGRFVNLSQGKVYPEYNEVNNRLSNIVEVMPTDTIYIGQDLNMGFSKAVAVIVRDNQLIVVRTFSFKQIGSAPSLLRSTFPENKIIWFPDASSKEIMRGYITEMSAYDVECRISNFNPPILERVFLVNKLFRLNRMLLAPGKITDDLSIALKVRSYDDAGKPEKGRGELSPDHLCDSLEYVVFRLVAFIPEMRDIWNLLNQVNRNKAILRQPESVDTTSNSELSLA